MTKTMLIWSVCQSLKEWSIPEVRLRYKKQKMRASSTNKIKIRRIKAILALCQTKRFNRILATKKTKQLKLNRHNNLRSNRPKRRVKNTRFRSRKQTLLEQFWVNQQINSVTSSKQGCNKGPPMIMTGFRKAQSQSSNRQVQYLTGTIPYYALQYCKTKSKTFSHRSIHCL